MKFGIAGNGNAAHHFVKMLCDQGHVLTQVYARTSDSISTDGDVEYITSPSLFSTKNDLVFLAVSDAAISSIAAEISTDMFVVHLSGMTSIDAISQSRKGVVWPVQSLSKRIEINYEQIPFLIEGSDSETASILQKIFQSISQHTKMANGDQRASTHLAAVFANNFANHLYELSSDILLENGFNLDLLLPMIRTQVEKLSVMSPHEAQTGPAVRMDLNTIEKQQTLLDSNPALKEIYTTLTNSILQKFHGKKL